VIWLSEATGALLVAAGPVLVAATCPVCASAVVAAVAADVVSPEGGVGVISLLLVKLSGLVEAVKAERLVAELAGSTTLSAGVGSVLRVLASWRSDLFALAGLGSSAKLLVFEGVGTVSGGAVGGALRSGVRASAAF
jgi:hypothetical protein